MRTFVKWIAVTAAAIVGAAVAVGWISEARARVVRGLDRSERIAENTREALAKTQEALEETEEAVRDVRGSIS